MINRLLLLVLISQIIFYSCSSNSSDDNNIVENLKLNTNQLTISIGEEEALNIVEAPSTDDILVWTSSDKKVATVFSGTVTAHQSGTATITATFGDLTAECIITVPERTYELVWSDDFDGTELNTDNWTYEIGNGNYGWGNNEAQYYTDRPENIRVEDGLLTIEARKENYKEGYQYTSARIKTANKQDFAYGKIEARLKVPKGRGTWSAFWMLGYGSWPRAGEIDMMEHVGYEPKTLHCALHTRNKNGLNGSNFRGNQQLTENASDNFHIVTMEWVEKELLGNDRISIFIDGVRTKTFGENAQLQDSGDWPFNDQFYFILNLAIGGDWGGVRGIDDTMFDNPVLYQIDYIKVYQ
jgi:beta-glucanase (GH16 family)